MNIKLGLSALVIGLGIAVSGTANSTTFNPIMIDFGGIKGAAGVGDTGPGHHEGTISADYYDWLHYNANTTSLTSETLCKTCFPGRSDITVSWEFPSNSGIIDWVGFGWIGKNIVHEVVSNGDLDNAAAGDSVRGSQNGFASGIRFDVAPGAYFVYASSGSSLTGHLVSQIYAGSTKSGTSSSTFSDFDSVILETTNKQTWEMGNNYARFEVTVAEGESLLVVSDNIDASGQAVWSTLQVVDASSISPVPIPAALPLMLTGFAALGFLGLRRKKSI